LFLYILKNAALFSTANSNEEKTLIKNRALPYRYN
jgi:hypothetical protein